MGMEPAMENKIRVAALLVFIVLTNPCGAFGETVIWKGWADFGSCNRVKYYKDDFGITWPTNESVGQTIDAEIYIAPTVTDVIKNHIASCALTGVAAAGATAIATGAAGAWPAFTGAFWSCTTSMGVTQFVGDNISVRYETHCNW